jgi:predicted RND superfamily exporter protein
MEAETIIEAFIQVVEEQDYVFSADAIADIPNLQQNLSAIDNLTPEAIAEVLRQWYINHEAVRDAILVEEREIKKVEKTKPQSQENTLENCYRILQDELQKLPERKKGENQQQ